MTRRKRGSGSVVGRPDGTYQAQWWGAGEHGRRRRLSETFATEAAAEAHLARQAALRAQGLARDPRAEPLGAYLSRWLARRLRGKAPQTIKSYTYAVERWEPLWPIPLGKLGADDVEGLVDEWLADGLSSKTVSLFVATVRSALAELVPRVLPYSPIPKLSLPKQQRRLVKAWDEAQAVRFLEGTRESPHHPMYVLALATGMRQSELLALGWADVEADCRALTVRRGLSNGILGPVKDREERRIILDPAVAETLRRQRARVRPGVEWVFPSPRGDRYWPSAARLAFTLNRQRLELPDVGFHGMRHTYATLQLRAGETLAVVSEVLGHANIAITARIYHHVLPGRQEGAARTIAATLHLAPSGPVPGSLAARKAAKRGSTRRGGR